MQRLVPFATALLFAACAATTPPASAPRPQPQPSQSAQRAPNALTAVSALDRSVAEPKIRVGLLIDQASVAFPRTADGYYVVTANGPSVIRRGFTANAPLAGAAVRYAVQLAAISDETSAQALVEKVSATAGVSTIKTFDPASGTYRILAGDFESSEAATPLRSRLVDEGYGRDLMVVRRPSDRPFERRIELVDDEGDRHRIDGAVLTVLPFSAGTIRIDGQPWRSSARLFVNPRGLLNVINELNLEEYLYGVVPAEMGPSIYDELEALKAQAVAARTYAIRNLGQFESEGYDICPGPACQAYKGFAAEHELSTRAVRETAGLVITYEGKPIDSLYSATCGGETSDVGIMFPGRSEPYLKSVRCVELELENLEGRADGGSLTESQLEGQFFAALSGLRASPAAWNAAEVKRTTEAAMRLAGFTSATSAAPRTSRRGDVLEWLSAAMRLEEKGRVLTLPEDRDYFFPRTAGAQRAPYLAAAFLVKFGIRPAQYLDRVSLEAPMPREELLALLGSWLREQNGIREAEGKIAAIEGRKLTLKQKGELSSWTLPAGVPVFRRLGDRVQEYRNAPVMIGDRAKVVRAPDGSVAAVVVEANYDGAAFDRTSSFSNWTRSYRATELVSSMNRRNPIRQLEGIRPLSVDRAGRVAELEVTAEEGRTFVLRGLPVRWSLNVPDNLFVYDRTRDPDGEDRYTFYGKGWGHGTGMCQVGAYGMAFRGWTFERILKHFYTGVEVRAAAR